MSLHFSFWVLRDENLPWAAVVMLLIAQVESAPAPSGKVQLLGFTCLSDPHLI